MSEFATDPSNHFEIGTPRGGGKSPQRSLLFRSFVIECNFNPVTFPGDTSRDPGCAQPTIFQRFRAPPPVSSIDTYDRRMPPIATHLRDSDSLILYFYFNGNRHWHETLSHPAGPVSPLAPSTFWKRYRRTAEKAANGILHGQGRGARLLSGAAG
jgi:hypothetical protein